VLILRQGFVGLSEEEKGITSLSLVVRLLRTAGVGDGLMRLFLKSESMNASEDPCGW